MLLKNADGALPIAAHRPAVALIGPFANATNAMLGNYEGVPPFIISPLMALQAITTYRP